MKGCQKKVIYLKNTGCELFEEAYFVVSRAGEVSESDEESMIEEANRIISDSIECEKKTRLGRILGRVCTLLFPFVSGVFITALIFAVF